MDFQREPTDEDIRAEMADPRVPEYPEGLLEPNPTFDIPSYEGDLDDLTERRNVKLYNLWTIWSDLRRNEKLIKMLEAKPKETEEKKYLKAILTITIDRLGKVLADTNIVEEICCKTSTRTEFNDTKTPANSSDDSISSGES